MKHHKLLRWVILTLFITSGCEDFDAIQKGVIDNNQRVESVMTSYDETKEAGVKVEKTILNSIKTQDISKIKSLTAINEDVDMLEDVTTGVSILTDTINTYIDMENETIKYAIEEGKDSKDSLIQDKKAFIDKVTEVHYFLDEKTGKVEQVFLVQLPNGNTSRITLHWLGGVVIDYTAVGIL